MKKLSFLSIACFLMVGFISCSQNDDEYQNPQIQSDNKKLEEMTRLYESYGWEKDSDVTDEERNEMLLKMDLQTFKDFLEFFRTGGEEIISNPDSIQNKETL